MYILKWPRDAVAMKDSTSEYPGLITIRVSTSSQTLWCLTAVVAKCGSLRSLDTRMVHDGSRSHDAAGTESHDMFIFIPPRQTRALPGSVARQLMYIRLMCNYYCIIVHRIETKDSTRA